MIVNILLIIRILMITHNFNMPTMLKVSFDD